MTIKGGGGPTPNGKTILNFHFDYLHPSLRLFSSLFIGLLFVYSCNWNLPHILIQKQITVDEEIWLTKMLKYAFIWTSILK